MDSSRAEDELREQHRGFADRSALEAARHIDAVGPYHADRKAGKGASYICGPSDCQYTLLFFPSTISIYTSRKLLETKILCNLKLKHEPEDCSVNQETEKSWGLPLHLIR